MVQSRVLNAAFVCRDEHSPRIPFNSSRLEQENMLQLMVKQKKARNYIDYAPNSRSAVTLDAERLHIIHTYHPQGWFQCTSMVCRWQTALTDVIYD